MTDTPTIIAGFALPASSPLFLAEVGVHGAFALVAVAAGAGAMFSAKRAGRHPWFGTVYIGAMLGAFAVAAALAAERWAQDWPLALLGALSIAAAIAGRQSRRRLRPGWPRRHIAGMGASYILMLMAFYVDNGHALPIWRDLPPLAWWLTPSLVGLPLIVYALLHQPLARAKD